MSTAFKYKGTPVTVTKTEGRWHIQANGNVYASRFLDDAMCAALPSLAPRERDQLVLSLLEQASR